MRHRVHTATIPPGRSRALSRAAVLSLLIAGLCACDPATQRASAIAVSSTHAPVSATPPVSAPSTLAADDALAIANARDQAARAARTQTLNVQRQLDEQRRASRDAAQRGNANERCIAGQKMRRVANGWVQAGGC